MMNLEVVECDTPWFANRDRLTSVVHLTGEWNGAVLVECERSTACSFAQRFLSTPDRSAAVDDVVRDVLGEIANMIGGNLKCVLSRGTRLSMPSVVDGDYSLRVCGAEVRERIPLRCEAGIFWIAVLTLRA
jgi:CheY-specific phosphatase CheX